MWYSNNELERSHMHTSNKLKYKEVKDLKSKKSQYKKQSKKNKELESKILKVISNAKRDANGESYKFVKKATEDLVELYGDFRFCKDENFLLYRYSKLEGKDKIWTTLFIPSVMTLFLSTEKITYVVNDIGQTASVIESIYCVYANMTFLQQILSWFFLAFILVAIPSFIYGVFSICKLMVASVTRDANTTIIENELCILRELLKYHREILGEEKAKEKVREYFKKAKHR